MHVPTLLALVVGALAVSTCGDSTARGRPDVAAEAGQESLEPARLAAWAARVPSGRPTQRDADFVAVVWVDYTLLAQALTDGRPLADSATAAAALMPDLLLLNLRKWHDTLVARRTRVEADRPDSLFTTPGFRAYQHILLRISDPQDVRQVGAARERADSIIAQLRAGADFAALARTHSDDPTAQRGGYLPPGMPGSLPPGFERAARGLGIGEVGGAASSAGLHVVRRPPLEEVRESIRQYAESLATRRADSVYFDSLSTARRLTVTPRAVSLLRGYFTNPTTRTAPEPVVTWDGGALSLARVALWIDLLQPRAWLDLRGASDLALEAFAREVAQQDLMHEEARRAGLQITAAEWSALYEGYLRGLRDVVALLGVQEPGQTIPPGAGPGRVAAVIDGLTENRVQYRPLPSALAAELRQAYGYRLHHAGLQAAAEEARRLAGSVPN